MAIGTMQELVLDDLAMYENATFVQRWYAFFLDIVFFYPVVVVVNLPFERLMLWWQAHDEAWLARALQVLLLALPAVAYFVVPTALSGQTLGKRIVGLRVAASERNGAHLGYGTVLVRELLGRGLSVASLGIGFLLPVWRADRRTLHDLVAATRVIIYRDVISNVRR